MYIIRSLVLCTCQCLILRIFSVVFRIVRYKQIVFIENYKYFAQNQISNILQPSRQPLKMLVFATFEFNIIHNLGT